MNDYISRQAAIAYAISGRVRTLPTSEDGENWIRTEEVRRSLLTMPSAQPDLDEWCTDCKEYDQERHCCPRWNRVIRNALKDAKPEQRWIPVTERLPEKDGMYLVTVYAPGFMEIRVDTDFYSHFGVWQIFGKFVNAWRELPEPYGEETENDA